MKKIYLLTALCISHHCIADYTIELSNSTLASSTQSVHDTKYNAEIQKISPQKPYTVALSIKPSQDLNHNAQFVEEKSFFSRVYQSIKDKISYCMSGAYQLFKSNRLWGEESGSCQSWTCLKELGLKTQNWQHIKTNPYCEGSFYNNAKVITCDHINSPTVGLSIANEIRKKNPQIDTVCMPYIQRLTNKVTGAEISHLVTFAAKYKGPNLESVNILDPQTRWSAEIFSNSQEIGLKDLNSLKEKKIISEQTATNFQALGIQIPLTGNCQKLALFTALQVCENKAIHMSEANEFCTQLHDANVKCKTQNPILKVARSWFGKISSIFT